jgi:hypothetical protein
MRVHAVLNRRARAFRRAPDLELRLARAFGPGVAIHATSTLEDLERAARTWTDDGAERVVLAGGDGTFMAGASAAVRAAGGAPLPTLALLPAGTVGRLARSLGIRGDPVRLARVYGSPARSALALQPSLRVRALHADGRTEERVGFIVGTGLVARFFDVYEERGAGGVADAARIVARTFASSLRGGSFARRVLDPLPCTVSADGHELAPHAWSLVCAAVVRDLGLGMRVTYRAGEDPGRVHLVAHALSPRVLGPRVGRVLAGRPIGDPSESGFDGLVRSFAIDFGMLEGPWVLDGDRLLAQRVEVEPGPVLRIEGA